jgi:hypothetical protein
VLDARPVNEYLLRKKWKMEDQRDLALVLTKSMRMCVLDLTSVFHHVPVQEELRQYLNFRYNGCTYRFVGMPFGIRTAPRVFSAVLRACLRVARETWEGVVFQYMDDILVAHPGKEECREAAAWIANWLRFFGWTINEKRCKAETPRPGLGHEKDGGGSGEDSECTAEESSTAVEKEAETGRACHGTRAGNTWEPACT